MVIRVFLADDHTIMREGLAALLEVQDGIEVIGHAANGREALRAVRDLKPNVVVMDIEMPELNGVDAASELSTREPPVPVLILSMHASSEHVSRALRAGACGYLLKESAAREIIDAVRAVHAGRRYLSPAVAELVAEHMRGGARASPLEALSARERQVLQLVAESHTSAEIAAKLHLSPKTVETYRSRIMDKLGVGDVAALVKFAIRHGVTSVK